MRLKQKYNGFTIVELLIVIVVIAILATISIVAYNGIQSRSNDAAVQSDLSNIRKKLDLARVDLGHYPQTALEFPAFKVNKSVYDINANNVYYITDTVNDTFAIGIRSKSNSGYILTSNSLQENVSVNAASTASAISATWGAAGTFIIQGYFSTTSTWNTGWSWTT